MSLSEFIKEANLSGVTDQVYVQKLQKRAGITDSISNFWNKSLQPEQRSAIIGSGLGTLGGGALGYTLGGGTLQNTLLGGLGGGLLGGYTGYRYGEPTVKPAIKPAIKPNQSTDKVTEELKDLGASGWRMLKDVGYGLGHFAMKPFKWIGLGYDKIGEGMEERLAGTPDEKLLRYYMMTRATDKKTGRSLADTYNPYAFSGKKTMPPPQMSNVDPKFIQNLTTSQYEDMFSKQHGY